MDTLRFIWGFSLSTSGCRCSFTRISTWHLILFINACFHIGSSFDFVLLNERLDLDQPSIGSQPYHHGISHSGEPIYQQPGQGEMWIFKLVPLGAPLDLVDIRFLNHDSIVVIFRVKSMAIRHTHLFLDCLVITFSFVEDSAFEFKGVGFTTHYTEEFNA